MKAKQVLKTLNISRPTLCKYLKDGNIIAYKLPNNQYYYDDESVYKLLNKGFERKNVIYARVSSNKQKKDLQNQTQLLKQYCFTSGVQIHNVYTDIASGISFSNRSGFFTMLDDIIQKKIKKVYISYKDRLSRVGFQLFKTLFQKFGCQIVVISQIGNQKLDSQQIFQEIVSLLHCYSMKLYSKRKNKNIQELIKE